MKTPDEKLIGRSPLRVGFLLIPLTLVCLGLSPAARAVDPPPDGGYPNGNTAEGQHALFNLDISRGVNNTAIGFSALGNTTVGDANTATGHNALLSNTTGLLNTANGSEALSSNTSGSSNIAIGFQALKNNTVGGLNTAVGNHALENNINYASNTAIGYEALKSNTTAGENTAIGTSSLATNTSGRVNTATGVSSLRNNTTGSRNTADGSATLIVNTTGDNNTASGASALYSNTTGSNNIALGNQAGYNLTRGSNNIDIGNPGVRDESDTIRIGRLGTQTATFIAGIRDVTTQNANAIPVVIDSAGQLGTMSSSRRFKKEIKPMEQTSEAILGLKPVTFHYKSDSKGTPQFGLIAEEVAQVNPDLVVRNENGEIYTVRYDAVNAMLLNEFLKTHRKMEQQEATIAKQHKQIEALTAGLQKVNARVEMSRPALRTVLNNQ